MTSDFVRNTCLLIRHDGCKKGTYPKGGRCVPAKAQQGGGGRGLSGGQIAATAVGGTLAAGALGAGIYASTRHGQRTIGKAEESVGNFIHKQAGEWDKGTKVGEEIARKTGAKEEDIKRSSKRNRRVSEAARNLGDHFRRSGKLKQAQNRAPKKPTKSSSTPVSGMGSDPPIDAEFRTVHSLPAARSKRRS